MTFKKLLLFIFLQWVCLAVLKLVFYKYLPFDNGATQFLLYAIVSAFVVAMLVRRLGVINYFEALYIMVLVLIFSFFADAIVTDPLIGKNLLATWHPWLGYLIALLSIFLFHKKRHIHVREEMHKHHQGHH